jgi:hypothetical protein
MAFTSQLRIYRIAEGRLNDFVERWREEVRPLRERHGFTVDGAWAIPEEGTFVWILSHRGPGTFEEADQAYYASAERAALSPDPADLIVENRTAFIRAIA